MAYKNIKPAHNLISAVENLADHFNDLVFDADHEAVYGMERFYTEEECTKIARKYEKAVEACNLFLHTNNIEAFLQTMKEMGYVHFLDELRTFVSNEIYSKVFGDVTEN